MSNVINITANLNHICDCGCYAFHVTREGVYCPLCGTWQRL